MQTAKLETYCVFGTANTITVCLRSQGRVLVDFAGHRAEKAELVAKARTWAANRGYKVQPAIPNSD